MNMSINLPPPNAIRERIDACEAELKALRRLLRASQDAHDADAARRQREEAPRMAAAIA